MFFLKNTSFRANKNGQVSRFIQLYFLISFYIGTQTHIGFMIQNSLNHKKIKNKKIMKIPQNKNFITMPLHDFYLK